VQISTDMVMQTIIILGFASAVGGLCSGFSMTAHDQGRSELKGYLAWLGSIISGICALTLSFAALSDIGYEVWGVAFILSLYLNCLGIGLAIYPKR